MACQLLPHIHMSQPLALFSPPCQWLGQGQRSASPLKGLASKAWTSNFRLGRATGHLSVRVAMEVSAAAAVAAQAQESVEAVFFDLDDTLVLTHAADKSAHHAVKRLLATRLPQLDLQAVIDHFVKDFISQAWDPNNQVDVTEWRAHLWNRGLLCQGVDDMHLARDLQSCFDTERLLAFRWADGVEVLVRSLQSQGVKVGIITNGHPKVQRAKLKACRAEDLFNTILVGGEESNEKPHKDIFLKACKLAGCKPEKAVMVGDNLKTDIQGGLNAGFMATVWVNVHELGETTGGARPHHTVTNIVDLQRVFKQYGLLG